MRIPLTVQWLRAAAGDPRSAHGRAAVRRRARPHPARLGRRGWRCPHSLGHRRRSSCWSSASSRCRCVAERAGSDDALASRAHRRAVRRVHPDRPRASRCCRRWWRPRPARCPGTASSAAWARCCCSSASGGATSTRPAGAEIVVTERNSWVWGYGHLPIFAAVAASRCRAGRRGGGARRQAEVSQRRRGVRRRRAARGLPRRADRAARARHRRLLAAGRAAWARRSASSSSPRWSCVVSAAADRSC